MAEFYFDNLAKNLPDCYKKDEKSNNYTILEIERTADNELRKCLTEIASILNIENASGAVLDMYGKKYGQPRGMANDAQYRIMIASKIIRNSCDGSYKSIVDALSATFGCSIDEILLTEVDVMAVELKNINMNMIENAGFELNQVYQLVKSLLPATTELRSVYIDGTFEFGEGEDEIDENAGFAISEDDQSVGGYLGELQSSGTAVELPI